jgi:hypothetical protein
MRAKIHTLVFLGFTALAGGLLSGCIVDNRNNPPPGSCLDQRYATVAWNIVKNVNNAPLSCGQANASTVYLYFGPYSYSYPCADYTGTTDSALPPGNYDTSMQLVSPSGQVLSDTAIPGGPASFPIYDCAPDDIPTVTFGVL